MIKIKRARDNDRQAAIKHMIVAMFIALFALTLSAWMESRAEREAINMHEGVYHETF